MKFTYTQQGIRHAVNQDSMGMAEAKNCTLLAISDGHGNDGLMISRLLVQKISNLKLESLTEA